MRLLLHTICRPRGGFVVAPPCVVVAAATLVGGAVSTATVLMSATSACLRWSGVRVYRKRLGNGNIHQQRIEDEIGACRCALGDDSTWLRPLSTRVPVPRELVNDPSCKLSHDPEIPEIGDSISMASETAGMSKVDSLN